LIMLEPSILEKNVRISESVNVSAWSEG
jgi:hypothetical protein